MVDDDTENDAASAPTITIDAVTGKNIIVDPVPGSVVNEITGAPPASLGSSVGPAFLAVGSLAQMTSGRQIFKASSGDDDESNNDAEISTAQEVEKYIDEKKRKIEAHAKTI